MGDKDKNETIHRGLVCSFVGVVSVGVVVISSFCSFVGVVVIPRFVELLVIPRF